MTTALFYFFGGLAVLSALSVILAPKPARALLSLIVTMFCLAALYLLLGAPFVAMVHLIVYAGAVLVLFLFVIMLQGVGATDIPFWARFPKGQLLTAFTVVFAFLGGTFLVLKQTVPVRAVSVDGSIEAVGRLLFRDYLIPFE